MTDEVSKTRAVQFALEALAEKLVSTPRRLVDVGVWEALCDLFDRGVDHAHTAPTIPDARHLGLSRCRTCGREFP